MASLRIRDIDVKFPFQPYPCQLDYMERVIEALSTGANALLESPTGTGKTLCLLCAALAWQEAKKAKAAPQKMPIGYNLPSQPQHKPQGAGNSSASSGSTLIIYASRTHSQLSQVVSELRASGYTPKMTVVASREQLCVHERISSLRGGALNHACTKVGAQRSCMYKNNLENYSGSGSGGAIMDIEQLAALGKQDKICPYFFSRDNASKCDLLLMPYNYLIDGSIRNTLRGVDWQGASVIIDEAHNLEQVASDASSFSISSADIAACIQELKQVVSLLQMIDTSSVESSTTSKKSGNLVGAISRGVNGEKPSLQNCASILKSLFELERRLDEVPLSPTSGPVTMSGGAKCCVFPGAWLVSLLEAVGLPVALAARNVEQIKMCADFLMDDTSSMLGGLGAGAGGRLAVSEPKLTTLAQVLAKVYRGQDQQECARRAGDFSVFIQEEGGGGNMNGMGRGRSLPGRGGSVAKKKRVINFWCFSPGVAMEELKRLGVRSLLLTSGTLSPMDAFREDLKIPFTIMLENPHVISEKQIWVSSVSAGPGAKALTSTYERRETTEYKDELADAIVSICQAMRGVPTGPGNNQGTRFADLLGGVLVFFPSYGTLDSTVKRWRQTGAWGRLCSAAGHVVVELKGSQSASHGDNCQGGKGKTVDGGRQQQQMDPVAEFESALQQLGRCMMLAVCRGKMSEGIDFRDSKGRVAIITGIPFAPHMDPWVVLKKMHLDDSCKTKASSGIQSGAQAAAVQQAQAHVQRMLSSSRSTPDVYKPNPNAYMPVSTATSTHVGRSKVAGNIQRLTGKAWYVQGASRAVNQALGRVIRHQKDWGAVFLLDSRFQADRQRGQLSRWVRPRLKKFSSFYPAVQSFREFCGVAMADPSLCPPEQMTPVVRVSRRIPVNLSDSNEERSPGFEREVVVSASALEGGTDDGEGDGYIDPSLLLSQRSFSRRYTDSSSTARSERSEVIRTSVLSNPQESAMEMNTTLNGMKSSRQQPVMPSKPMPQRSIADIFSKNKTVVTQNVKKSNVGFQPFKQPLRTSENVLAQKLRMIRTSESLQSSTDSGSNSGLLDGDEGNISIRRKSTGLESSSSFSEKPKGFSQQHQSQSRGSSSFGKELSQILSQSQRSSDNMSQSRTSSALSISKKSKREIFKDLVSSLKAQLSSRCFDEFYSEIKRVSIVSKQTGPISDVVQIRQFVDNVVRMLTVELSDVPLREAMIVLGTLFPEKLTDKYRSIVRETVRHVTSLHDTARTETEVARACIEHSSMKRDRTDISSPKRDSSSSSTVQSPSEMDSDSQQLPEGRYSKRARHIFMQGTSRASESGGTPGKSQEKGITRLLPSNSTSADKTTTISRGLLSHIDNIELSAKPSTSSVGNTKKLGRLQCIICSENPPTVPCASKCGHICCRDCWKKWLAVKSTCPLCRISVSVSDIARIRVA